MIKRRDKDDNRLIWITYSEAADTVPLGDYYRYMSAKEWEAVSK